MILFVDNYDSFSYNLLDYLYQVGASVHLVKNSDSLTSISKQKYQAVVLSPGPSTPADSGNLMDVIHYYHDQIPMLGICLGHQAIGQYFGATLVKALQPMHGKISEVYLEKDPLFDQLSSPLVVTRYHSLILTNVKGKIKSIATTKNQEIMAIKHIDLPIYGLQFHPEAYLTQQGLSIIKNWVSLL